MPCVCNATPVGPPDRKVQHGSCNLASALDALLTSRDDARDRWERALSHAAAALRLGSAPADVLPLLGQAWTHADAVAQATDDALQLLQTRVTCLGGCAVAPAPAAAGAADDHHQPSEVMTCPES